MTRLSALLARLARLPRSQALRGNASTGRSPSRRLFLESLEPRQVLAAFTVIDAGDNGGVNPAPFAGTGTLRQAIIDANASPGHDTINFNIPGSGVHTIHVIPHSGGGGLPIVRDPVTIDGYSQPGAIPNIDPIASNAELKIELDGSLVTHPFAGAFWLEVGSENSAIRGLVLNRFPGTPITVSVGSVIAGNFIGTDATGMAELTRPDGTRQESGIFSWEPTGEVTIGGSQPGDRNVISGNGNGVKIWPSNSPGTKTRVVGNLIGTNRTGNVPIGNIVGVQTQGFESALDQATEIGGIQPGERNVISGNSIWGIALDSGTVRGNYIGTNAAGTAAIGNTNGISPGRNYVIGGTTAAARNVISGSTFTGVVAGGSSVPGAVAKVQGNFIGTDWTGQIPIPNLRHGVSTSGSNPVLIGGPEAGAGNVISASGLANLNAGSNVTVQANFIGTNSTATAAIGHTQWGIIIDGSNTGVTSNVITGHWENGVVVTSGVGNSILRNSIFANGRGIDLLPPSGVTGNDLGDADEGANRLQNFPEMNAATVSGSNVTISYHVPTDSANATYPLRVEFFKVQNGERQGQTFLGYDSFTAANYADGAKTATFTVAAPVAAGDQIVATATDAAGNTSEFSALISVVSGVQSVSVDIHPESLNVASNGTLTVFVYGAADFDVSEIDVTTVEFAGAAAWQSVLTDANGDGILDLQLKFRTQDTILDEIYAQLLVDDEDADGVLDATRQLAEIELTGELVDQSLFSGSDSITLFLAGKNLRDLLEQLFG